MGTQLNRTTAQAQNPKAIAGVNKHFAKVKTLTLAGATYTPAALKALLQAEIDETVSLDQSRAQLQKQVASTHATQAKARAARKGLRAYLLGLYGADAVDLLQDFGFSPPKPTGRKSVKVKAEAVIKSKATREARHTMSKKQKKLIKGDASQADTTATAETPAPVATPAATVTKQ